MVLNKYPFHKLEIWQGAIYMSNTEYVLLSSWKNYKHGSDFYTSWDIIYWALLYFSYLQDNIVVSIWHSTCKKNYLLWHMLMALKLIMAHVMYMLITLFILGFKLRTYYMFLYFCDFLTHQWCVKSTYIKYKKLKIDIEGMLFNCPLRTLNEWAQILQI